MNIAIAFSSEDYQNLIGEIISDCSEGCLISDRDAFYESIGGLREISFKIAEVLDDIFYVDNETLEEYIVEDDPYSRFVARMILKFKTIYPGADIVSLSPINLEGNLLAVFCVPDGSFLNLNAIR